MENSKNLMLSVLTTLMYVFIADTVMAQPGDPIPGINISLEQIPGGLTDTKKVGAKQTANPTGDEEKTISPRGKTGNKATIPQAKENVHPGIFDNAQQATTIFLASSKNGTNVPGNIQAKRKYKINEKKECRPFRRKH